jgi:hypothetical protein
MIVRPLRVSFAAWPPFVNRETSLSDHGRSNADELAQFKASAREE